MSGVDGLADEIYKALQVYSSKVDETVQNELYDLAKDVKNELKHNGNIPDKSGEYRRGFYTKKIVKTKGFIRLVIANKKYWLTHLLERPHAHVDNHHNKGGRGTPRVTGQTQGYPQWEQAQEHIDRKSEEIFRKVEKVE